MAVDHRNAGGMKGTSAAFDCNKCLDAACDPVVTFCGHLYCWPCLYKRSRAHSDGPLRCPVCKAELPGTSVVPLYGGSGEAPTKARPVSSLRVPRGHPRAPLPNNACTLARRPAIVLTFGNT
ncbi:unnamed protein product [Cuscuta campestris]|uniref:E3 ubiquitin-protein ligase RMA n=1 Tax=Cuscuta campestris TaxID=132261 RepID=A0A484K5A9_9ASTE|nr:unnamed protein product [Cuscuta campestris]